MNFELIKVVSEFTAILHDVGKSNDFFQKSLVNNKKEANPLRHEFVSCMMIKKVIDKFGDLWIEHIYEMKFYDFNNLNEKLSLYSMPKISKFIMILILSHHKLPTNDDENYLIQAMNQKTDSFDSLCEYINENYGYKNSDDISECKKFSSGTIFDNDDYNLKLQEISNRLLEHKDEIIDIINDKYKIRLFYTFCRLCLMLSDYYVSSSKHKTMYKKSKLYANTDDKNKLKQTLIEHNIEVSKYISKIYDSIFGYINTSKSVSDLDSLNQKSPDKFMWQDKAVDVIHKYRSKHHNNRFFVVNLASTGAGKTFANAKLIKAISKDEKSLRYSLALGLRSLTLQTGDEYSSRIKISKSDLAVLIGSSESITLHQINKEDKNEQEDVCQEDLLSDNEVVYENNFSSKFLDMIIYKKNEIQTNKNKAFLFKPIVVSTIDYNIKASECIRGAKYIIPMLRLMTSDLVIDEIDDFSKIDLIAISRLVFLAGMFNRNVIISSASITPFLSKFMFNAFSQGAKHYDSFFNKHINNVNIVVDEFDTSVFCDINDCYLNEYMKFINKRVSSLSKQIRKRHGTIIDCQLLKDVASNASLKQNDKYEKMYCSLMLNAGIELHKHNYVIDAKTNKKVSIGMIRVAHIGLCVKLGIVASELNDNDVDVKFMVYHSRQSLILRNEQENYLDKVMKRKNEKNMEKVEFNDDIMNHHIQNSKKNNIAFIVIVTPVEETGRDHDFDWAVVEPSSYRSLIQLSGRVLRHRDREPSFYNIAIMQYNSWSLRKCDKVFCFPGYEVDYTLSTHDVKKLIDDKYIKKIDAIPRIFTSIKDEDFQIVNKKYSKGLIELEHQNMYDLYNENNRGPGYASGYINEFWYFTGISQMINKFRNGSKMTKIYYKDDLQFYQKGPDGKLKSIVTNKFNIAMNISFNDEKCWLNRNYNYVLKKYEDKLHMSSEDISLIYGEISFEDKQKSLCYHDQLGLYEL